MTTYISLIPSNKTAQVFQATFDGGNYTCAVRWNLFAQRFYILCNDDQNTVIFNLPIIQSPKSYQIQSIYWDPASLKAYVTTRNPHKLSVGSVARLNIKGFNPSGYNGEYDCNVTSKTEFNFQLPSDPGNVSVFGSSSFDINMIRGYFTTSSMIYRNNQLEISP